MAGICDQMHCQQLCNDTLNIPVCQCSPGYEMDDNAMCIGMENEIGYFIYYK